MTSTEQSAFRASAIHDRTRKRLIQWVLAPIVPLTIALGWKYPLIGYIVPVTMMTGMAGGFFAGRYICGNICPRGGFLDRMWSKISPTRPIPLFFRNMGFRWSFFAFMIAFMGFQISRNPTDLYHIGWVFWLMCTVTTGIALVFGLLFRPRTWCSFCPIGTFSNVVGGDKKQLVYEGANCKLCGACEKVCPIHIPIMESYTKGVIAHRDCLRCHECVATCSVACLKKAG